MTHSLDEHYVPAPTVLVRQVGDELVLLDTAGESYFSINETGRHLWHAVTVSQPPATAVASLVAAFDTDEATARSDLALLLSQLVDAGLLRPASP